MPLIGIFIGFISLIVGLLLWGKQRVAKKAKEESGSVETGKVQENKSQRNGIADIIRSVGVLFLLFSITFLVGAIATENASLFGSSASCFFEFIMLLGFSEVIQLLQDIKNK